MSGKVRVFAAMKAVTTLISFLLLSSLSAGQEAASGLLDDLSPVTLSWNQVHALVRENLAELDLLRLEHEEIYKEIQSCYGLEKCLKSTNLLDANIGIVIHLVQRGGREKNCHYFCPFCNT